MARNAEKAMTTLARWRQAQITEGGKDKERRPYLASLCDNLSEAEKWRIQIIREIAKKVAQIQNAGLGEFRIRDLNDEINKLLREKRHWEVRIIELGGRNFIRTGPKMLDHEGREVPGNRGYKYFGAARYLPGVRELFENEPPPPPRKTRAELMKEVDADYYGYRDDDDGVLIPLEKEEEKKAIEIAVEEWKSRKIAAQANDMEVSKDDESEETNNIHNEDSEEDDNEKQEKIRFIAHVPVPSQQEIEEALLRRKKQELLDKYISSSLMEESTEAKDLLGIK